MKGVTSNKANCYGLQTGIPYVLEVTNIKCKNRKMTFRKQVEHDSITVDVDTKPSGTVVVFCRPESKCDVSIINEDEQFNIIVLKNNKKWYVKQDGPYFAGSESKEEARNFKYFCSSEKDIWLMTAQGKYLDLKNRRMIASSEECYGLIETFGDGKIIHFEPIKLTCDNYRIKKSNIDLFLEKSTTED